MTPHFTVHRRLYYRLLGLVYGFAHWTRGHRFFGLRWSNLVGLATFIPLILAWRQNRPGAVLALAFLPTLLVWWGYWRARRVGYKKFVPGKTAVPPNDDLPPLPPDQRVALKASGIFGVADREEQLFMCPAEYWRVPLGDHTVMVQPEKGRFLYQFFNADNLQAVEWGWLLHGVRPQKVLAITFFSAWGKDPLSLRELYQSAEEANRETRQRVIYLCFDDDDDERTVWRTIMDARSA